MHLMILFFCAGMVSLLITAALILLMPRLGIVAKPNVDRWHSKATPLLGGVAIFVPFAGFVLVEIFQGRLERWFPMLVCGALLFGLGLVDDLVKLRPQHKLFGQIFVALLAVWMGISFTALPFYLSVPLTVLWIVGVTNAFNLLDNMDGLAAGVALISSCLIGAIGYMNGLMSLTMLSVCLAGALMGFLVFNFHPAKVFMGDCGSMFLGSTLAVLCVEGIAKQATNLIAIIALPLMVLAVPIFDTTIVTFSRLWSRRPVSKGGKDHLSHRLVFLGLSERKAVLYLYGLSLLGGCIALAALEWKAISLFGLVLLLLLFAVTAGFFLGSVRVAGDREDGMTGVLLSYNILFKSARVQLLLDVVLVSTAYLVAHLLRFEGSLGDDPGLISRSLPIVILVKVTILWAMGLHSELWEYPSISEALKIIKATVLGSVVSVTVLFILTRLDSFSRAMFVIDGLLAFILVGGARFGFALLRELFPKPTRGKRTLIYGTGEAGSLILRLLRSDGDLGEAIGFLDDEESRQGRVVHGVRVIGRCSELREIIRQHDIEQVLVAKPLTTKGDLELIRSACRECGVTCSSVLPFFESE